LVENAREAIRLAREVIKEAGYVVSRVADVEYDDDDHLWHVTAYSGDVEIELTIDENDDVADFKTNE